MPVGFLDVHDTLDASRRRHVSNGGSGGSVEIEESAVSP